MPATPRRPIAYGHRRRGIVEVAMFNLEGCTGIEIKPIPTRPRWCEFHLHPSPSNVTSIPAHPCRTMFPSTPVPARNLSSNCRSNTTGKMFDVSYIHYAVRSSMSVTQFKFQFLLNETGTQLVFAMVRQRFSSARTRQKWFLDMHLRESRNLYFHPLGTPATVLPINAGVPQYVSIREVFPRFRRYSPHPRTGL